MGFFGEAFGTKKSRIETTIFSKAESNRFDELVDKGYAQDEYGVPIRTKGKVSPSEAIHIIHRERNERKESSRHERQESPRQERREPKREKGFFENIHDHPIAQSLAGFGRQSTKGLNFNPDFILGGAAPKRARPKSRKSKAHKKNKGRKTIIIYR